MRLRNVEGSSLEAAVSTAQIGLLFDKRFDLVTNVIVSALTAVMFWRLYPSWVVVAWLVSLWSVIAIRAVFRRRFAKLATDLTGTLQRGRVYTAATFVTAALWGLTGSVVLLTRDPVYYVLVAFVVGGVMTGGIVSNAAYKPALFAFLIPAILPLTVGLLARRNPTAIEMAALLAIYTAVLAVSGKNINRTIVEGLRSRFAQDSLVADLRAGEESMAEAQRVAGLGADELAYRDRLLEAVSAGTAILLDAPTIDFGMREALRTLGESMRLDRISVLQEVPDLEMEIALRYNWEVANVPQRFDESALDSRPTEPTEMVEIRAQLTAGEVVIGQRASGGGPLRSMVEHMQTESLLLVPILVAGRLWGSLRVESVREKRPWTQIEISTFKAFGSIVGSLVVRDEARLSLESSERRFRVFSGTAQDAIVTMDGAGLINHWNVSAERILGYGAGEALGRPIHEFMIPARFKEKAARGLAAFLATGEGPFLGKTIELTALRKNGTEVIVEVSLARARIGDEWQAIGIMRDVSARKRSEEELQFANMLLKTEMESSPDGILVVDADRRITSINQRFVEMWGLPSAALEQLDDDSTLASVAAAVKEPERFSERVEYLYDHPDENGDDELDLIDGRTIDRRTATLRTSDAAYLGRVWYFRDISPRKRAESFAIRMAHYDVLTGLANRSVFVEALAHAIADAKRGKKGFAVIYLDLDHFKDVNDTLGHPVGDDLLRNVAERLRANVRAGDTVARFGGDEFAVVLTDVGEPADAALVADKLIKALAEPFSIRGNDIRTGASIGIDLYGTGADQAETLLSHADVALYRAKAEGRGAYRFFTDAMDRDVRTRVTLGADLRTAVATDQLFLVYQPQVDVETGRITGLEALVRWNHPGRGIVFPDTFIPVAESSGIIVALGRWVLSAACRQAKVWIDAGIAPVRVAVNVSGAQFKMPLELEATIAAILEETRVPARLLEIELTETGLMEITLEHSKTLERLRAAGVTVAIDDFGTGYSSLGYLRRFPVDRIKIARDFVRDLTTMPGQAAIAKATIGLARDLGISVIAEGVETRAQLDALKHWGCGEIQGYYFAEPLDAAAVTRVLRAGGVLKAKPV